MITIACATNDSVHFIPEHFGEAESYAVYEVDDNSYHYMYSIRNTSEEYENHDHHGDAVKAKHVMMMLKTAKVQVVMNKAFGPNINRIKITFLPVITTEERITDGLEVLMKNMKAIEEEIKKGNEKKHLVLK